MIECWKPVPGYEDLYQVSDRGRVRRIAGGMGARIGRILRARDNGRGYPFVTLYRNSHSKHRTAHTLVTGAFLGPCPDGLEVNHKNGIRNDPRLSNLEYVTPSENAKHSFNMLGRKGPCGEINGQAKLTAAIVKEIRRLRAKYGVIHRELAERYGVTRSHIGCILGRKNWAHVT